MIIQCDFDGTITRNNLSVLLREKFAPDDWRKTEADYSRGYLPVEQSNKLQFALIREPREKLQQFVRQHIDVKPGFLEFVSYCRQTDTPLVIVSSGLDFYIEPVLSEIGLPDLEVHCGQTSFGEDGIGISYYDPEGNPVDRGFKKKHLDWLKRRDKQVVYIGDGLSDLEPARHASRVFATGQLLRLLSTESVASSPFSDFYDLLRQLGHQPSNSGSS